MKLQPTPEQEQALLETVKQFTACYNFVARYGWDRSEKNGVELHKSTYYELRGRFPQLPSQLVVSARMRATESLASAFALRKKKNSKGEPKKVSCPHSAFATIRYDMRSYRFDLKSNCARLSTVAGRLCVPFQMYDRAQSQIAQAEGFDSADLIYRDGSFFLHLVVTLPDSIVVATGPIVGVDFAKLVQRSHPTISSLVNDDGKVLSVDTSD